jgi:hypothetical protein
MLDRAYFLIAKDRIREAASILDIVILDDPHNIEAWELYMQITASHAGLEALAERVYWHEQLSAPEKDEILSYQQYVLEHLDDPRRDPYEQEVLPAGPRSALFIIGAIFLLLVALWLIVPDVRTMTPYYFLMVFLVGLAYWFWRSDQPGEFGSLRSYSYGVPRAQLGEPEQPRLFYHEPIIKVGPVPEEEERERA